MADKKFDLGDYIEVKERIKIFYELYAQGRLVTGEVRLSNEPDGVPRVLVQGLAYRSPDDTLPGVGWSWMVLPGTSNYTRGSELENTETSAWGRAIASLGILIDRSIASAQEVENKQDDGKVAKPAESADPATNDGESEEMTGRVSRRGVIRKGGPDEYKLIARQGPDGHQFGIRLEIDGDKAIPQCVVSGAIGESLFNLHAGKPETLVGKVATVAGILYHVTVRKAGKRENSWYRLHVDRFETDDILLPAPQDDAVLTKAAASAKREVLDAYMEGDALTGDQVRPVLDALDKRTAADEPPDDVPLAFEAPTAPLFDDVA